MNSEEAESKDATVKKSRDSKWLITGSTESKEGRVTRKAAGKLTPKVALRASLRKKTKNTKSKTITTSKSASQAKNTKKRKLNIKNDHSSKGVKSKKNVKVECKGKKGDKKNEGQKNPSNAKKVGAKRKRQIVKKKTKAEIVVGDDNVIHIKTGLVEETEETDENDLNLDVENETEILNPPKKRVRKQKKAKTEQTEGESHVKQEPTENGFPSIEDELKLIEGEKVKAKSRKAKAKARRKYTKSYKPRKPQEPTRHCNLCTESFYSELDLAYHCREVHFKTKFVFKDAGISQILGAKGDFVKANDDMEKEHQYARDEESAPQVYTERDSDEDIMNEVDSALRKTADKSSDDLVAAESVVFVRKVREEDKKFCQFCKKIFLSSKGLKDHIEMRCSRVPFRCFCGKGLKEPNELHTHYPKLKIPKYKSAMTRFECPNCKQRFSYRETLQNHSLTCQAEESSDGNEGQTPVRSKTNKAKDKVYSCDECDRVFTDRSCLRKHEACHNKETGTNVCDVCGKCYATKGGLRTHRETHTDDKKFICEHCGSGFYQKGNLMQHLKTDIGLCKGMKGTHSVMMDCNLCKRSFTSVNRLKQHERKHQRLEELSGPDGLVCKDCGKSFTGFHQLQRHLMTHAGERPHKCKFCEKSFTQKSNMMAHMRIHTGYRPYECYICGQGFTQGTTLKIHVEKNHDISTYKFKKLPRGRKCKDTSVTDDRIVDIEEEYIQRALQDGSYLKTEGRRGRGSSVNVKREGKENDSSDSKTREISTQADDDEEDYYYDDDSDEDEYDYYSSKRQEAKSESSANKVQVKNISGRKIYFQVVDEKGDSHEAQNISIDTSTLSEAIKRSLYEPGLHPALDEAIQRTGYVQRVEHSNSASQRQDIEDGRQNTGYTINELPHKVSAPVAEALRPKVQSTRAVITDSEEAIRRLSEEAVKRSLYEARGVVPATTEAMKRFLAQQDHVPRVAVSQVPQVQLHNQSSSAVTRVAQVSQVQMQNQSSSAEANSGANTIETMHVPIVISSKPADHAAILAPKIIEKVNENIVSQPAVVVEESYEAVKYSPINETETKEAVISLQNDQDRVEINEQVVQKYQVLEAVSEFNGAEHSKNPVIDNQTKTEQFEAVPEETGVEYVTVIFEDDGTQTIEQEIIELSQAAIASSSAHSVNIGQDSSFIRNVSNVVSSVVSSGIQGTSNVVHISQ